jgi:hypothetical protein
VRQENVRENVSGGDVALVLWAGFPIVIFILRHAINLRNKVTIDFALRRKYAYRLSEITMVESMSGGMGRPESMAEHRGGGDRSRTDAFRFAPGNGVYAFAAIGALGLFAIGAAVFDLGDAQAKGVSVFLVPAGLLLVIVMLVLFWLTHRRPVLLTIGPDGLDMPAALAHPVAWRDIWRMRRTHWRHRFRQDMIVLKIELPRGVNVVYKRRLWTMPRLDSWIARNYGLSIPIHNLDAGEALILASIERFRPVQRVSN